MATKNKYEPQMELIANICDRLDLNYKQLAEVAGINRETMRKYIRGYQKMGDTVGILLKHVERQQLENRNRLRANPTPSEALVHAYSLMEGSTLDHNFQQLANKLGKTTPRERPQLLENLRAMLNELQSRVKVRRPAARAFAGTGRGGLGGSVSSEPLSGAARLAQLAGRKKA